MYKIMAKKKKIPTNKVGGIDTCTKSTVPTVDGSVCPTIDPTPDIQQISIDEPTVLNLTCPTPKVFCEPGVDPALFNSIMQPLLRKICNLEKLAEMQLCLFSKFVENSNTKIIEKEVCLEDGTKGCKLIEKTLDGEVVNFTVIGLLDSFGEPTELQVITCPEISITFEKTCN